MKILLAPAKTLDIKSNNNGSTPLFINESLELLKILKSLSKDDLAKTMKIKDELLEKTYNNFQNFENLKKAIAIESYNGMVYKKLDYKSLYNKKYLDDNLIILDAFYGMLRANDLISQYRLDFKMKPNKLNLYKFWEDKINEELKKFEGEEIISLASGEFEKLIKINFISIAFKSLKNGVYKNVPTFSKMARGSLLREMAEKDIRNTYELKKLCFLDYTYNKELSDDKTITFTRQ